MIYVGTNDGFVHGFNTGEPADTADSGPGFDRGTGVEMFGFMAYPARQKIADLPNDLPPREYTTSTVRRRRRRVVLPDEDTPSTGGPAPG